MWSKSFLVTIFGAFKNEDLFQVYDALFSESFQRYIVFISIILVQIPYKFLFWDNKNIFSDFQRFFLFFFLLSILRSEFFLRY